MRLDERHVSRRRSTSVQENRCESPMKQGDKSPTDTFFEFDDVHVLTYLCVACFTTEVWVENHALYKVMLAQSATTDWLWDDWSSNNVAVHLYVHLDETRLTIYILQL